MAIFHLSMTIAKREGGKRSLIAMASYRSGEKLYSELYEKTNLYNHRTVKPEAFILKPDYVPNEFLDRQTLWNKMELAEKQVNSQICREVNVALPIELNNTDQRSLIEEFVKDNFVSEGMIADVAIHRDDENNPHAHIMLTMREVDSEGNILNKRKKIPKLDENGKVIEDEYDEIRELTTLNSMVPIWKKNKNDVTDEMLDNFYMDKFYDYEKPMLHLMFNVEGNVNYSTLLFIPNLPPRNLHSIDYEKGLQLYSKGVFIMDKCKELIPDYLRFVKGVVDSSDLSLNISREMLQQNKVLLLMQKNIEKKIINRLQTLQKEDFAKYKEFFKNYGINLKFGAYENYGSKKELLQDLLIYQDTNTDDMISLKTYVENMKEGQKDIYFASGKTKDEVLAMPQMDIIKKYGYDVLILTDDVDEFLFKIINKYQEHEFKSVNQATLDDLSTEEEKAKINEQKETNKDLLEAMKEALKDEVKDVVLSTRLVDSPVCLVSGDGISFEMEKVIDAMPTNDKIKADRILEVNPNHDLFKALSKVYSEDPSEIKEYAKLLYNQALLMEGFKLPNNVEFSNMMCKLMIKSAK